MFCLPLTVQAQIYLYASTKAEWKALAENSKYSNTEVYVTLTGDFTIDNDVDNWEDFKGTLDGNGHTITVDYKGIDRAPLRNTVGYSYVKNLRIEGTIENHLGWISYDWANPLVRYVGKGTLKVTNCHSRVHYKITDNCSSNRVPNAGFVGKTEEEGSVIFENCSYIGSIKTNEDNAYKGSLGVLNGGMIGEHDGKDLKIYNCFSYIDAWALNTERESKVAPFVGTLYSSWTTFGYDNNYSYVSNYVKSENALGEIIDDWHYDRLSSGEIAYKLNQGKTDDDVIWLQTIGKDLLPMNRLESPQSKEVYYTDAPNRENCGQWVTLLHPLNVTLPEGAKVYVVADIDEANKKVKLCKFNAESYAHTPIVVYCPDGIGTLELPNGYYNRIEQDGILTGNYDAHTAQTGDYVLEGDKFVPATGTVAAGYCYLRGGTADAYTIDTTSVADDVFVISSKSAWNLFKSQYSGKEVNAYLTCDLTLTAEDEAMESFKGTLEGQGHSIIYDFDTSEDTGTDQKKYGLFYQATGTIKNLNITGKIQVAAHITSPVSYPAPLAFETHGSQAAPDELNIENCHSDVSYYTGGNSTYTGAGFILSPVYTTINFKDCSYTGTFASPHHKYAGGFIGQHWSSATVNLTNCFSDVHIPSTSVIDTEPYAGDYSPQTVGYFIGKQKGGTLTLTNCYAHNSSTLSFGTTLTGQTIVSDSLLKIGEVTYKLQASRTGDDNPWAQTIGTDSEPQLQTFSAESKEVYHAASGTKDYGTSTWATFYYPAEVTLPETLSVYKVTEVEDGTMTLVDIFQQENKDTPLLLHSENGIGSISLPALYYNRSEHTGILRPVYETTTEASGWNLLQLADGQPQFAQPAASTEVPEWTCYSVTPATAVALGEVVIKSKADWNAFKTNYNDQQVKARLACDLDLGDDDAGMESFRGTFDGNGHTLNISYTSADDDKLNAPFMSAAGTIKNLNIEGEIKWEGDNATGYCYVAPLVNRLMTRNLELTIDNCHSNVTYTATTDYQKGSSGNRAGGFIRIVGDSGDSHDIKVHFTDCSAIVKLKDISSMFNYGGFVGLVYRGNTATFDNCYADMSDNAISKIYYSTYECDYFAVPSSEKAILTATNCYARKATYANTEFKNYANVTVVTDDQVASGEATYKLNAGRTGDDVVWAQTIGTDAVPQLALFSKESKEVHEAAGGDYQIGTDGWGTLYYPTEVTLPDGVKAYTLGGVEEKTTDGVTENCVVLNEIETSTLSAYTPAILCSLPEGESAAAEVTVTLPTFYYNNESDFDESQTALLYGVLEDTEAPNGSYLLQNQDGTVAFYQVDNSEEQSNISAFRCVLLWEPTETQQSSTKVILPFGDKPTGITSAAVLEPLLNSGAVYDLQGRQVQSLQKGQVYIKNGQKFTVK